MMSRVMRENHLKKKKKKKKLIKLKFNQYICVADELRINDDSFLFVTSAV